ncbi:hypothetical protein [Marinicellulosiphila megalodicopiae]|uniref:hypothetical protein n=1 Tax=Marinicellulosiphila megalodicopiae TaxID=2724896 RepID=UPI003BAEE16F
MINKIEEIEQLLEDISEPLSKVDAKNNISRLRFLSVSLNTNPYAKGKLDEAINHAINASKNNSDKNQQILFMNNSWSTFESVNEETEV